MATLALTSDNAELFRNLLSELKSSEISALGEGASPDAIDSKYATLAKEMDDLNADGKIKELVEEFFKLSKELLAGEEKVVLSRVYVVLHYCKIIEKTSSEQFTNVINQLVDIFTNSDDQAATKTRLLASIFNVFDEKSFARYLIFKAIFAYAARNKFFKAIAPHVENFESMMSKWPITSVQMREIYGAALDVLKDQPQTNELRYKYLKIYLEFVQQENSPAVYNEARTKEFAQSLAVMSIQLPNVVKLETVTQLTAIKNLGQDSKTKTLLELFTIFEQKGLPDFSEWHKKNPNTLKEFGLDYEACLEKIRLLTLCSLAAGQKSLSYEAVAKALNIGKEDVEFWVVNAVSNQYMGAQIDELSESIHINHTTQRNFGQEDWKNLKTTISLWRSKIQELKDVLANARAQEAEAKATKA
eukprot:CAMPEP_0115045992 /NCGR_PEP_ID=MMETSP0216-20121206/48496_1 /TAXON_ID=223996 /ORGANISM="Protocruzia adherens, Strain Boccale" /LENGTH=415 /DNA_ID=CAMNT_0002429013 /DNA_START=31 /DNA_END=1278 /DNA_ORIENTATION=+